MDHVLLRTKLHAVIARAMIDAGLLARDAVLHEVHDGPGDPSGRHLLEQRRLFAGLPVRQRRVPRHRLGVAGMAAWLWWMLLRARLRGDRVFVANLHWASLGLALRLQPGARIHGFDDGSANVQRRAHSFLAEDASTRPGPGGWLSRRLFPAGVAHFARSRIVRHATIYPRLGNVVPPERLDRVTLDWSRLLAAEDADQLPGGVRRLLVGSVFAELNQRLARPVTEADVERAVAWADLYVPHPRQPLPRPADPLLLLYPVEAIIEHYARRAPLQVAHFDSSAALPFAGDPRIEWINLLEQDLDGRRRDTGLPVETP